MSSPIDISKPYYLDLPSGERIDFPAGTTAEEARIFLMQNRPELFLDSAGEEDRSGFFPGLVSSAQRLSSEISAAVPATYAAITGDEESLKAAQEIAQEGREAVQETLPDPATVESIKEAYDKEGLWSAIGESFDLAKESTGSQVPIFAGTFAAGAAGAFAAPAVGLTAAAGTLIGGLAWTAAYTYSQFISESASEAESAKDIEALKSLAYTAPHTLLNYLGYLATGAFGPVKQRAASATLSSVLNSTSKESGRLALAAAGRQAGESLLEFPTELAQTVLERSFSGESISPDDADFVTSMIETAAATIAPTALFGGVGAYRAHRQENLRQNEFRKLIDEEKIHRESLRQARENATAKDEENADRIFRENVRRYEELVGQGRETDEEFIRYAEEQGALTPVTFSDVVEAFSSRGLDYGSLGSQYVDAFILRNTDGKARKLSDLEDRASLPREERNQRAKLRRRVFSVASGLKGYAYSQYGQKSSSRAGIPLSFYSKAQFDQVMKRLKQRKKVTADTIRSVLTYSDGSRFGNSKIEKRVASEILRDLEAKNYAKKNKDGSFRMYNPGYTEAQYREIIDTAKEKGEITQEDFEKVTGKYGEARYNRFVDDAVNRMDLKKFRPREVLAEEDPSVEPIVTVVRPVKYPQFRGQQPSPDLELNYNFPYYRGAGDQNVSVEEAEGYFVRDSDGQVVDGSTNEAEAKRIANYLNSISGKFTLLKNGEAYKSFASREMAELALKGEMASLGPNRGEDIFVVREGGAQTFEADSSPSAGYRVVERFVGEDGSKSDFYEDSFSPDSVTANQRLKEKRAEYYTGESDWERRSADRIREVLETLEGGPLGAGRTAEQVMSREEREVDPARFDLQRNQEGELEPAPPPPLNEMEQKVVDSANKALSSLGLGNIDALVRGTLGDGVPAAYDLLRRRVLISLEGISKASTQAEIDEIVASRVGHEVIHALRDMDVFNPEEWNSLVDASRRVKVGKHILDEGQEGINEDTTYFDAAVMIYQNSVPAQIASDEDAKADFFAEEAVAMMHEGYKTDTRVSEQLAPKSRTLLDKIKDFFVNLYTSISALGYEDPGAILNDISNKSIAGRIAEDVDLRTYDPEIRTIRPSYRAFSRAATPGVQRPASGVGGLQETQTIGGVQRVVQAEDDQTRQSRTRRKISSKEGMARISELGLKPRKLNDKYQVLRGNEVVLEADSVDNLFLLLEEYKPPHEPIEMNREESVRNVLKIPENIRSGWYRSSDSGYKTRLVNLLVNDPSIRNGALNIFHKEWQLANGTNIGFDDFMETPIRLYRGGDFPAFPGNSFVSFSLDPAMADRFKRKDTAIQSAIVIPKETYGMLTTTGEAEVLVPPNAIKNLQTVDDLNKQSRTRPDTFEMSGSAEFDPATGMWNDGEFVSIGENLNSQHLIDSVDQIPTEEELNSWGPFRDKVLTAKDRSSLKGKDARLRIDINFFNHHKSRDGKGKYAVTVHDTKDGRGRRVPLNAPSPGKRIGYDTIARLLGPIRFGSNDRLADRILNEGMTKQPIAVVEGKYTTNRSIPKDIDKWTPVGYDPHKATFFYDKRTGDEIISGKDAISIGNTVFVRSVDPWNDKTFKRYSADMASEMPMRPRRNVYTEQERARIEDRIADQVSEMSADEALKYSKKNSMKLEESFGPDGLEYKARFPVDGIDFTMSINFTEDVWDNPFNTDMETITDVDFTIAVSDKEARTKLRDKIRQMESDGMIVPDAFSAMLSREGTYRSIDWRSFFNEDPSRKILHTALSGIDKFISSRVGKAEPAIGFSGSGKSRIISEGLSDDSYSYRVRRSARERIYSRIAESIAKKNNYDLLQTVEIVPDYGSGTSTNIDPDGFLSFSQFYLVDRASQYNSAFKNRYLEFKETVYAGSPQDLIYEKLRSAPENVSIKVKSNENTQNFEIDGEDFHDNLASFFFKRSQTKASNPASIPYINTAPPGSLEIRPDIDFRKQLRLEAEEIATGQSEGLKMSRSQIDQDNNRSASVNRSAEYQTVLDSLSPEYENLSLIQKIKNAFWDPIERKDFLSSLRRGFIDKLSPIATTEEEANRVRRELGYDERLTADVRAVSAAYQKDKASLIAQESILYGQPEYVGGLTRVNFEKQGLMEIISDVMNEGLFHDWHAWMISRREIRLGKDGKVIATGPDSDLSKSLESGSARAVIDAELDKNPGRRELFEKTNEAYQEWNANLMNYLKDTGVIDQNLAEVLTRFNDYIPFYRVFDGTASSSMSSDINNIIGESLDLLRETIDPETGLPVLPPREPTKEPGSYDRGAFGSIVEVKAPTKIKKGGEGLIVDPLDGIFRNLEAAINAGMANVAATKVLGDALILDKASEVDKRRVDRSSANIVTIRDNGQDRSFEVDDAPLFHALSGLMEGDLPMMSIFSAPANWLREGVVRMPDFMVANLMKDSLQTFVTSGAKITPFVDTLKQFTKGGLGGKQIHGKNDPHSSIMKLRGAGVIGGIEMSRRAGDIRKVMEKRMRKQGMTVSGKKGSKVGGAHWNPISKIWDTLGDVSTKSDAATRMAVYENTYQRMIQKGYSKIQAESEAIFQAQEIMNFSRRGSNKAMRYITAAIPFLNARIQGLDLLWRAGRGKYNSDFSQVGKARSFQSLLGRASLITAVTFLYALMMHDDEDWYSQTPEAQDDYWFVKIGDQLIKIPVPFEIGFLFKTIPERIIRNLLAGKKEGFGAGWIPERAYSSGRQTADSFMRGLTTTFKFSPMESPLLKPFASVDSFTKRPIVPLYLEKKLPEEQYRDSTSALARIAGSATGISPLRLEYLTRAFTGSTGAYLLNITDNFWRSASGMPSRPKKNIGEMAFFKRFVVPTGISAGPMSQFYQFFNEVEKIYNTIQDKVEVGDIEGARELAEKYPNVIPAKKQADRIKNALADVREQQTKFNLQDRSREEKDRYRIMANERRREILSGLPSLVKGTDLGMF